MNPCADCKRVITVSNGKKRSSRNDPRNQRLRERGETIRRHDLLAQTAASKFRSTWCGRSWPRVEISAGCEHSLPAQHTRVCNHHKRSNRFQSPLSGSWIISYHKLKASTLKGRIITYCYSWIGMPTFTPRTFSTKFEQLDRPAILQASSFKLHQSSIVTSNFSLRQSVASGSERDHWIRCASAPSDIMIDGRSSSDNINNAGALTCGMFNVHHVLRC